MELYREWRAMVVREFAGYRPATFQRDLLAGLTVAAVALPLALAFGVASGADAAAGLVTAILAGLVIGFLGGAPYQISGPTGAMSAILVVIAARHGLQGLWMVGLLAGAMMVVLGLLRLGRVVSLIPAPVISGFTSGIAVIIALGQLDNALGVKMVPTENVILKVLVFLETPSSPNLHAVGLTLLVVGVMLLWPRLPFSGRLPGSLVGIAAATALAWAMGWDVPVIGQIPRTILLDAHLDFRQVPWREVGQLVVPAMSVAALGAIESLLCGAVAGNMTGVRLHSSVELVAQGAGNLLIPFFGGVPATAAIARTSVSVKSGGVTRLAPVLHGIALLLVALLFAPLLGRVPLSALAGVLAVTAWRMNEWHAIRYYFGKRLKHAMAAFLITLAATVMLDLTQAVVIGFGLSAFIFIAQMSDLYLSRQPVDPARLEADGTPVPAASGGAVVYYPIGPLFFSSARKLLESVESQDPPSATVILSMRGVPLVDATGIEVLRELMHRQRGGGGDILLTGVAPRVEELMRRSGFLEEVGRERLFWSADRAILSLKAPLPQEPPAAPEAEGLDASLLITPHEDRTRTRQ